jgi:hypothetical protein
VNGANEWHRFFGCKVAQEVWIESEFWERMHHQIEHATGFKQLVFHLIELMDSKFISHVAMLLWTIYIACSYVTMGAQQQSATLKCNIDVACFMNANKFCIGACIRDVNGGLDSSFIC